MANIKKQDYLDTVATKLINSQAFLAHGPLVNDKGEGLGTPLRDEIGVSVSFSNILNIAENFYGARQGRDVVADYTEAAVTNFSGGESYGNVSLVQTMGA
jgi:hypothetical protein